jgi:GDPmannose 4,6-dehydratase
VRAGRTALIFGVTGQDGAYLSRLLLEKGYSVHGTSRDASMAPLDGLLTLRIRHYITLHSVSPIDFQSVLRAIEEVKPDEIYNLSGQSSVGLSFSQPAATLESILNGTLNVLEAIRQISPSVRFYNAGSSECFGETGPKRATEATAFRPKSPYGIAKTASVLLVANYREAYGLHASSGLLFNHESPLRPHRFVTRKITSTAARIASGSGERLVLGNLEIRRDWGWAPEYVDAMWRMLQLDMAEDIVIASGKSHTLEEFVATAFNDVGLNWREHVEIDSSLRRPSDIKESVGDPSKAARLLNWKIEVPFCEIVARMIRAEREGVAAVS